MFSRIFGVALRGVRCSATPRTLKLQNNGLLQDKSVIQGSKPNFTTNRSISSVILSSGIHQSIQRTSILPTGNLLRTTNETNVLNGYVPVRTVIKFSMSKGKRRSVKTVLQRFYRLNWGIWIRTKAARHKRRWRKRGSNLRRARQHVFCNATQSWLLDKMVTAYWRKPKYFVDDPYNPYHEREYFRTTRKNPMP